MGRVAVVSAAPLSAALAATTSGAALLAAGSAVDISDQAAKEGVWDLRRSGLEKVRAGLTSLEEVNSVTIE